MTRGISVQETKRASFDKVAASGTINDPFFRLIKKDPGIGVSQSGGSLLVTTGLTAYEELIMRSNSAFDDAIMMRYSMILSQRIANNNFAVELVDVLGDNLACTVNSTTQITVTIPDNWLTADNVGQFVKVCNIKFIPNAPVGRYAIASVSGNDVVLTVSGFPASGTGTVSLVGMNYHQVLYNGTTATNAAFDTQRFGYNSGSVTATISTTASPGHIAYVSAEDARSTLTDEVSPAGTPTQRATRARSTPGYDKNLYVQIHVYNGSSAPATTTTMTMGFVQVDSYIPVQVSITSSAIQAAQGGLPVNLQNSSVVVGGAAAHDGAVSGNPVRIAGRALTANYTAVATGDTADLVTTLVGALVQKPYSIPEADWTYAAATGGISNTTTAVTFKAAAAAGIRNYITGLDIFHESLTTATELAIRDGAAGTVIWRTKIQTGAAGRIHIQFITPLKGTAATLLEVVTLTASGGGAVFFNAQGYIAP